MSKVSITIVSNFKNDKEGAKLLLFSIYKFTDINNINIITNKNSSIKFIKEICEKFSLNLRVYRLDLKCLISMVNKNNDEPVLKHIPNFAYAKLLIPEIISDEGTLYLDTDTLFISPFDIDEFNGKKNGKLLTVVKNGFLDKKYWFLKYENIFKNENEARDKAFNSGVIFFNLKKLKNKHMINRTRKILGKYNYKYLDQSYFNSIYKNKVNYVSLKYNYPVHSSFKKEIKAMKDPTILHFASKEKPWTKYNLKDYNKDAEKFYIIWRNLNKELNSLFK